MIASKALPSILFNLYKIMAGLVPGTWQPFGLEHWQVVLGLTWLVVIILVVLLDRLCRAVFSRDTKYISKEEVVEQVPQPQTTTTCIKTKTSPPVKMTTNTTAYEVPVASRLSHTTTTSSAVASRTIVKAASPVAAADDWEDEVSRMSVVELRQALKDRNLSCFGTKNTLAASLIKAGPPTTTTTSVHVSPTHTQRTSRTTTYVRSPEVEVEEVEEEEEEEEEEEDDGLSAADIEAMSLAQLRQALKDRGMVAMGSKDLLMKKLMAASPRSPKRKRTEGHKNSKRSKTTSTADKRKR